MRDPPTYPPLPTPHLPPRPSPLVPCVAPQHAQLQRPEPSGGHLHTAHPAAAGPQLCARGRGERGGDLPGCALAARRLLGALVLPHTAGSATHDGAGKHERQAGARDKVRRGRGAHSGVLLNPPTTARGAPPCPAPHRTRCTASPHRTTPHHRTAPHRTTSHHTPPNLLCSLPWPLLTCSWPWPLGLHRSCCCCLLLN